jgi:DNA polymerase phi
MDERQLSDKAKGLLRSRIGHLKQVPPIVDTERVGKVLTDLHSRTRRVRTVDILTTLSQCSLYLSKLLLQSELDTLVLGVYRESLVDFLTRKNSALNVGFFQDFIRRFPITAWGLRDDLIKLSSKAVNVCRQCQAFQLLQVLVGQLSNMVSVVSFVALVRAYGIARAIDKKTY